MRFKLMLSICGLLGSPLAAATGLHLNARDYFAMQGLSVLVYQNTYHPVFRDQKMGGIEIILHGDRIATGGEVRLLPTPEQQDPVPTLASRERGPRPDELIAVSGYPDLFLGYRLDVTAEGDGFRVAVDLDRPLPPDLAGKAGFNLEFLPTAYFGKSYMLDDAFGIFPRHPDGPMRSTAAGASEPLPLARGHRIVLSPEDPATRVTVNSDTGEIALFDGRNKAQNGWFVIRELIPAGRTTNAVVWHVHPHVIPGWVRPPVVSYNQVGYTPERPKVAVMELDPHFKAPKTARVVRLTPIGSRETVFEGAVVPWGKWLRYQYSTFDFSTVRRPGIYAIEYAGHITTPFRIGPDVLQQVRHGVLALLAQYAAFGHAIPGIIVPTLEEYTHLGDAASQTDGKIYSAKLGPLESRGDYSGKPDDRWAFTTHTTPLNYAAAASLAAPSRVLRGFDGALAARCLATAVKVWRDEHGHSPAIFRSFNTTGGELDDEEVTAAVELLIATKGDAAYATRLEALLPVIRKHFPQLGWLAARAIPYMDASFKQSIARMLVEDQARERASLSTNPFGVPIATGTWGGSAEAAAFAVHRYYLHTAFPDLVGTDDTLRGFDYVLGRHPASNVSYVSTVGTRSKLVAYGNNRADYTFISGGMIPGVVVIQPDFPELKRGWPFLWYENEYVVDAATTFILAANAAEAVAR